MQIDWVWGLLGGGMIGCAAAIYLLINGRIMGASGIVGEVVDGTAGRNLKEPVAFLAGLIGIPGALVWASGGASTQATAVVWPLVLGGFCVGIGTRLANGCTSGHGVCGISRLSPRGIVATLVYVGVGALAMVLLRHGLGVL